MRIDSLHNRELVELIFESEGVSRFGIDDILNGLSGKLFIVVDVKATGFDPDDSQVVRAASIVLDGAGNSIDSFDQQAALSLTTLQKIDAQDSLSRSGEWEPGDMSIRDMLNYADYDLSIYGSEDASIDLPNEMEVVSGFGAFVEKYAGKGIIVGYDVANTLSHINSNLARPIAGAPAIDAAQFTKSYFIPVVQAVAMTGLKRANEMFDKLIDERGRFDPSLKNISAALGIKTHKWQSTSDVENLAKAFSAMLRFLRMNQKWFKDENYLKISAAVQGKLGPRQPAVPTSQP